VLSKVSGEIEKKIGLYSYSSRFSARPSGSYPGLGLFGLFGPLAFAESCTWAASVLVDEFDARRLDPTGDAGPPRAR
jgi:hypothetical protein